METARTGTVSLPTPGRAASPPLSLVERARRLAPPVEHGAVWEGEPPAVCADGYRRVLPVQPYYVPDSYRRRQKLLAMLAAVLALGAAGGAVYFLLRLLL